MIRKTGSLAPYGEARVLNSIDHINEQVPPPYPNRDKNIFYKLKCR